MMIGTSCDVSPGKKVQYVPAQVQAQRSWEDKDKSWENGSRAEVESLPPAKYSCHVPPEERQLVSFGIRTTHAGTWGVWRGTWVTRYVLVRFNGLSFLA